MITDRDPADMTADERLAEIAQILAKGYLRLLVSRESAQNDLEVDDRSEAPCGSQATNPQSTEDAA